MQKVPRHLVLALDANYELGSARHGESTGRVDEREVYSHLLLRNFGLTHTRVSYTWSNTRGASSKIDYILLSSPTNELKDQWIFTDSDVLLGSDHRAVAATFAVFREPKSFRPARAPNRCGKWVANSSKVFKKAQELCYKLDLSGRDLSCQDLSSLAQDTCFRPKSYRYRDPPEIIDKIRQRRALHGREAGELGKEIVRLRAVAKNLWLTSILDRSANGDYRAVSYFRRRQSALASHNNYLIRAGGKAKAIGDRKKHFRVKWSEPELQLVSPLQVRHSNSCMQLQPPSLITEEEICEVLAACKPGKSCGPDGVSYELLQLVMQTECRVHVVELLNSVLFQPRPSPTIGSIPGSLCAPRSPILTF